MSSVELESTRIAFSKFATGVCIVTAVADAGPIGMTVSSFNSVSLDPPLVLWSVGRHAPEYPDFCNAKNYIVHVLSAQQVALSNRFATPGIDKFEGLSFSRTDDNIPLLSGVVGRFHCSARHNFTAGDHNILVGLVTAVDQFESDSDPLIYYSSNYRAIGGLIEH